MPRSATLWRLRCVLRPAFLLSHCRLQLTRHALQHPRTRRALHPAYSPCRHPYPHPDLLGKDVVDFTMSRGWWAASARVLDAASTAGVDISTAVHQTASRIQQELQKLRDLASKKGGEVAAGIPPAFEWAQSPEALLLNVKFAHKWDTPATLGCVVNDGGVVFANRSVEMRSVCEAKKKVRARPQERSAWTDNV